MKGGSSIQEKYVLRYDIRNVEVHARAHWCRTTIHTFVLCMYGLVSSFKVQVFCLYYIHYIIIYYISFSQVIN